MTSPVALSLRMVAALQAGAVLVARPRGVVHFHTGPLTTSRSSVPATARPLCGIRSRRLHVVGTTATDLPAAAAGRRFCRTCTAHLPDRVGVAAVDLDTRAGWEQLYGDLSPAALAIAAAWCRTVDETYQVQRTVQMVYGSRHQAPELHRAVEQRRTVLTAATRTDADREIARRAREDELFNHRLEQRSRAREVWLARLRDRARTGRYLTADEREALRSA